MTTLAKWTLPIAALSALLAGCGGGSGGGTGSVSAAPPPVITPGPAPATVDAAAAWHDYVTAAHAWKMTGKGADGRAYELAVDMKPGASAPFPLTGAAGLTTEQAVRFTIDGATSGTSGTLYLTGDSVIGVASSDGACAPARAATAPLPAAATVGQQGPLYVLDGYAGCKLTGQKLGTTTFTWSIETDGALNMFCITSQQQNAAGANIGTEVDCVEVSAAGALGAKAKFALTKATGESITGRNF